MLFNVKKTVVKYSSQKFKLILVVYLASSMSRVRMETCDFPAKLAAAITRIILHGARTTFAIPVSLEMSSAGGVLLLATGRSMLGSQWIASLGPTIG